MLYRGNLGYFSDTVRSGLSRIKCKIVAKSSGLCLISKVKYKEVAMRFGPRYKKVQSMVKWNMDIAKSTKYLVDLKTGLGKIEYKIVTTRLLY